jgi:hypothetical protein
MNISFIFRDLWDLTSNDSMNISFIYRDLWDLQVLQDPLVSKGRGECRVNVVVMAIGALL